MQAKHHLAQVNIATGRAPLDDPIMAGFVARLEPLNALAESMPGFIWRLQTDDGDATAIQVFDNPRILFNLTLWESIEALEAYVYHTDHVSALRRRSEWFERPTKPSLALWWVRAGHIPDESEARERLVLLEQNGPDARAFTFRHRFTPDGQPVAGRDQVQNIAGGG